MDSKNGTEMPRPSDGELKKKLTPEEFHILREKGTERPFSGKYWDEFSEGEYLCKACGTPLFESGTKFDAHCGWPSFSAAISAPKGAPTPAPVSPVEEHVDRTHGMVRTEVTCRNCGSHLGHVFPDGPPPTGLRYCINSASIDLRPIKKG